MLRTHANKSELEITGLIWVPFISPPQRLVQEPSRSFPMRDLVLSLLALFMAVRPKSRYTCVS